MENVDDEFTPLLHEDLEDEIHNYHHQFCMLVGIPPSDWPKGKKLPAIGSKTLYSRATRQRRNQNVQYQFTAALSNTLLLSQVILGAALTALGASESSHILITLFGATNTVIAGLVAYLKSRGQPMRAQMFRDDLERVCDEIENSEIMWLGISTGVHGYSEINTNDIVTVRSEVARLTRLYDRAIRNNTANNPDNYQNSVANDATHSISLRAPSGSGQASLPVAPVVVPTPSAPAANPAPPAPDPDESPATAPKPTPPPVKEAENGKDTTTKTGAGGAPADDKKDALPNSEATPAEDGTKDKPAASDLSPSGPVDKPAASAANETSASRPKPSQPGAVATTDDDDQAPATKADPPLSKEGSKAEEGKGNAPGS